MPQLGENERVGRRGYALCVGIGTYPRLVNRSLRYAVEDAEVIAEWLADPQRGDFAVTVLTEPTQTTKVAIEQAVEHLLSAPKRRAEDLALLYFSCHGDLTQTAHTFCLLPSDASLRDDGMFDPATLVGIHDFARWFANATVQNIVVLLDVCHSGGAGAALQHFTLKLETGPNFFFIGAARLDQVTMQSSLLQHGVFTHCLLRAFEQPPTSDGWLTISQIQSFVSDEIPWFAKDQLTQIQSWSVSVNPNLPLLRNPGFPELCPLPPLWNVPFQRNIFFTGQEELLSRLASMLQRGQKTALTQPHALSGLGGIGKTQLALEYAYRHRQDYHAILWGSADTTEALISTFVNIAYLLDLPQRDEPDQMVIIEAVKSWLGDRDKWLFILDNADDLALVIEFLPPAFRGHLLLTTRAQTMGKIVGSKLEVETMSPEMGALLLLRRARMLATEAFLENAPEEDVKKAKELSEELGGLPLALDQAGAYIEEAQCSLADYQQQYQARRAELLARRGGLKDDHPKPVATTWSLSFQKIEQISPIAAEVLQVCAFLAPDAIPVELVGEVLKTPLLSSKKRRRRGGWFSQFASWLRKDSEPPVPLVKEGQIDEAIALLRTYSLIQRNATEKTLIIHRLVQAVLHDSLPLESQHILILRSVQALNTAFPDLDFANWPIVERLLPHALVCATWIEQVPLATPTAVHLLTQVGYYLVERGQHGEAEPLYKRALAISEQDPSFQQAERVHTLNGLATLYRQQGKYAEAEVLYQRALVVPEQELGADSQLKMAFALEGLATLYQRQGRSSEAEPLYQRVLSIREQAQGPQHLDMATSLNNLAILYYSQGRYDEAEPLYQRAVAIDEQQLGPQSPMTAAMLNNLANLYQKQERYAEAEPMYQRALSIRERTLGPQHPDTAISLHNLAGFYKSLGRYAEAEPLSRRALVLWEQELGPQHPNTASGLNILAEIYRGQRRHAEAEPLHRRALAIREQVLGPQHPSTAQSLYNLALLYSDERKYTEAEPLMKRALVIREQVLGMEHPDTRIVRADYMALLESRKQDEEVE